MLDKDLPLVRLFWLEIKPEYLKEFQEIGAANLNQSIQTEAGTLAMYSAHRENSPTACLVFEIYENDKAYQTHVKSAHFQAFAQLAPQALSARRVVNLHPQVLQERQSPITAEEMATIQMTLTTIKAEEKAAVPQLLKHLTAYHQLESSHQLAFYLANDQTDEKIIYLLELHQEPWQLPTFLASLTQEFTYQSLNLVPDCLVNQGNLSFFSDYPVLP